MHKASLQEATRRWLIDEGNSIVRILRRQNGARYLSLEDAAFSTVGHTAIVGIGALKALPDAFTELWVEPVYGAEIGTLSFWIAGRSHKELERISRASDLFFPEHFPWKDHAARRMPPFGVPVLDYRYGRSIFDGESFFGVWLGEYVPRPERSLPSLLRTDIAYFFYQIGALTLGREGDPRPVGYGKSARRRVITTPSRKSVFSSYACPTCANALPSYLEECDRCGWSRTWGPDTRAESSDYPDELPDT